MPIVIACGACGSQVTVPDDYQRQFFACPFCARPLTGMPPPAIPIPAVPPHTAVPLPVAPSPPADALDFAEEARRKRRRRDDDDQDSDDDHDARDDRRRRRQERQGRGKVTAWILVGVGALVILVLGVVLLFASRSAGTRPGKKSSTDSISRSLARVKVASSGEPS